jgi:hypothetical protein
VVNLPISAQFDKVPACGKVSRQDIRDKFVMAGLTPPHGRRRGGSLRSPPRRRPHPELFLTFHQGDISACVQQNRRADWKTARRGVNMVRLLPLVAHPSGSDWGHFGLSSAPGWWSNCRRGRKDPRRRPAQATGAAQDCVEHVLFDGLEKRWTSAPPGIPADYTSFWH